MSEPSARGTALSRFLAWGSAELFFVAGVVVAILFAVSAPDVSKELDISASQLGTLSGVFFVTYSVGQLFIGSLLGTYAPRLLLGAAALLSAAGCLLFSVAPSMPVALAARVLLGLGVSVSFVGVMHVIGRDYAERFSFMAALSQSLANVVGGLVGLAAGFSTVLTTFREPSIAMGIAFVPIGIALLAFIGSKHESPSSSAGAAETAPIGTVLAACFGSLQFWMGLLYYACLFGTILAYSDLWDIQFQMQFFGMTSQEGAVQNAAIAFGVTVGSLAAGAWAQARGDFVLPARVFGLIAVLTFAILFVIVLDDTLTIAANFIAGFALGGSILGFTALQKHLPPYSQATATAIVATAAFVMGGVIQPLVGMMVSVPVTGDPFFKHLLMSTPDIASRLLPAPDFATYQRGLMLLCITVTVGFTASLWFKRAPEKGSTGV